jgi:hypothetical protein
VISAAAASIYQASRDSVEASGNKKDRKRSVGVVMKVDSSSKA